MLDRKKIGDAIKEAAGQAGLLVAAALAIACLGLLLAGAALAIAARGTRS